jgi:hypothetical protein
MKIELYQAETEKICLLHQNILEEARERLQIAKNHWF